LRAFAAFLNADHSTLSQILRGSRQAPVGQIRAWARKLDIEPEEVSVYIAAAHVPERSALRRLQHLRHWTSEAMSVVTDRAHWEIVRLSRMPGFQGDSRWTAEQTGLTIDEINLALSRLLRLRLLEIRTAGKWNDLTGLAVLTEPKFREVALARAREKAAEAAVGLSAG
jgi:transcriptional regulator with XRE-family HTH domain